MTDDIWTGVGRRRHEARVQSLRVPSVDGWVRVLVCELDVEAGIPNAAVRFHACHVAVAGDTREQSCKSCELLRDELHVATINRLGQTNAVNKGEVEDRAYK